MDETTLALLRRQIEDQKQTLVQALADGSARDYAEYRFLCGKLLGLSTAQYLVDEFIDRARRLEDDDN